MNCDSEAAGDVTQETFVRAIETIGGRRGNEEAFFGWLLGITRRVLTQRARKANSPGARVLSTAHGAGPSPGSRVAELIDPAPPVPERIAFAEE